MRHTATHRARAPIAPNRLLGPLLLLLLLLSCVVTLHSVPSMAATYNSRFIGFTFPATTDPSTVCSSSHSGFLPNIYSLQRDNLFMQTVPLSGSTNVGYALSGTIGTSTCNTKASCEWKWSGGPMASNPMTFFFGTTTKTAQDQALGLYHRWNQQFSTNSKTNPRAYYTMSILGWRAFPLSSSITDVACEVLVESTSSSTPGEESIEGKIKETSSGSKWWIGLIVAAVVIVVIILGIIIFFQCCRTKKANTLQTGDNKEWDAENMDINPSAYSIKNDGISRQQSFSGDGGMMRQQSFAGDGGMMRQQSFAGDGGMMRQQSFAGDGGMMRQQSFGGGNGMMPRQQSFNAFNGMAYQQGYGGMM